MKLRRSQVIFIILFLNIEPCFSQINSDYEKIPVKFDQAENRIILPVKIFNRDFDLILTTLGKENGISEKGLFKLSDVLGQDIKDYLYSKYLKSNPELKHEEIEKWVKKLLAGESYIFSTSSMTCGAFSFGEEKFRVNRTENSFDGSISMNSFRDAKTITLNLRENILEINKKLNINEKENRTELFFNQDLGFYYFIAEINGVKQPVLINLMSNLIVTRENFTASEIYEGKTLRELIIKKLEKPIAREKKRSIS